MSAAEPAFADHHRHADRAARHEIPLVLTGTAVGMISLIGYTPDIFAGPAMGFLLDRSPGETGHQHVFWMLAIFAFIGILSIKLLPLMLSDDILTPKTKFSLGKFRII